MDTHTHTLQKDSQRREVPMWNMNRCVCVCVHCVFLPSSRRERYDVLLLSLYNPNHHFPSDFALCQLRDTFKTFKASSAKAFLKSG